MTRSLAVHSVLYRNDVAAILRAAEATSNAARFAISSGDLSEWTLLLGDCSESAALDDVALSKVSAYVTEAGGRFRYEFFGENLGHGGAHNRLAPLDTSDLIFIVNPDVIVAAETIARLVAAVSGDVALADGRQLPLEHPKDYDPETGDQSWASGACAMTVRSVFDQVGGFDHKTFFMYCDDVDYSWRVRLAGYRVVFEPSARVFHDKRLTTTADIEPTPAENIYSDEAALLLAHKYSREDEVERMLKYFIEEKGAQGARVVSAYRQRVLSKNLPTPIDNSGVVAQFIDGNYAKHRY